MRVKTGTKRHAKHKKIRKAAKGFRGHRGHSLRGAKEGLLHAGAYAYRDRRRKKREFRKLWIQKINAAVREQGVSYSQFVKDLKAHSVILDRKILTEIATEDPETFTKIVNQVSTP